MERIRINRMYRTIVIAAVSCLVALIGAATVYADTETTSEEGVPAEIAAEQEAPAEDSAEAATEAEAEVKSSAPEAIEASEAAQRSVPADGVTEEGGVLHYYQNGTMQKGRWISVGSQWYYAQADGRLCADEICKVGSAYYGFDLSGVMCQGLFRLRENSYLTDASGALIGGTWTFYRGHWYYARPSGALCTEGIYLLDGEYYAFDLFGAMFCGNLSWEGKRYVTNDSGVIQRGGWRRVGENWLYAEADGALCVDSIRTVAGSDYAFNRAGVMMQGRILMKGVRYLADASGAIFKNGWKPFGGSWYYAQADGALLCNTIREIGNAKYGFASDGRMYEGLFVLDGKTYLAESSGAILNRLLYGVDVSVFQGTIDWEAVRASGMEFAIIRVGGRYGKSGALYADDKFLQNIAGAKRAGLKVGVYFFSQAITEGEAREEVDYTLSRLSGYALDLPVVIDTEYLENARANSMSAAQRTAVIKEFCRYTAERGYTPMIYASTSWLNNNMNMSQLSEYLVWVAQWKVSAPTYQGAYICWQNSSAGSCGGIQGRVDTNIWYATV